MPTSTKAVAATQLKSVIDRVERLEEDKATVAGDIKQVYAEAKANGFDVKIIRKIVALRKKEDNERKEEQSLLDLYMEAIGMLPPSGEEE